MKNLANIALAVAIFAGLIIVASGYDDRPHPASVDITPETEPGRSPQGTPKIVAKAPTFNYGKVKQGKTVEHTFKIRNEGTGELIIRRAKGS